MLYKSTSLDNEAFDKCDIRFPNNKLCSRSRY